MYIIPSLNRRYLQKIFTNIVVIIAGGLTTMMVTRALGPGMYGKFEYLLSFFNELLPFLTFASGIGYYTMISSRPEEKSITNFYILLILVGSTLAFFCLLLIRYINYDGLLFPDIDFNLVLMGYFYVLAALGVKTAGQMSDAYGLTIEVEKRRVILRIIFAAVLFLLFINKKISIEVFYFFNYSLLVSTILIVWLTFNKHKIKILDEWFINITQIKNYTLLFYNYSKPLLVYATIGVLYGVFDRWLLQWVGGSVEQGFFGIAFRVGALCFVFTSALTSLLTREFTIAFHKNNIKEASRLFRRYIPLLYSLAAFISIFVFANSKQVAYLFGGTSFINAQVPIMIMSLYPIHQTYGQLSGSVFYAKGETKLYTKIGISMMVLGSILTWIFIAPERYFGFSMGATGLAIKFVITQFIMVNVQLYYNSKLLNLRFVKYFFHQNIVVITLIGISTVAKFAVSLIQPLDSILNLFISAIIYSVITLATVVYYPKIFGLYVNDIDFALSRIGLKK